jgi:hypothetical protein
LASSVQSPPLILLDDPRGLAALRARLERDGWRVQESWELSDEAWDVGERRLVCSGRVDTASEQQAALLAGARGAGLIVIEAPAAAYEFIDDLERLGPVERRAAQAGAGSLNAETIDLLSALARGLSVAQAARETLMSLRTAHRRLAAARDALGVTSNSELLVEYARRKGRP